MAYHWNPWFVNSSWLDKIEEKFGRPDFVHFHDIYEPFEIALARLMKRRGWRYIFSPHGGLQPYAQMRKSLKKAIGNFLFSDRFIRDAVAVHVLNDAESDAIARRFPHSRVFTIPNGVSDGFLHKAVIRSTLNKSELIFGFIGRIDIKHKGIDLLLEAVSKLQKEQDALKIRFVFAGPFHSQKDEKAFNMYLRRLRYPQMVEYKGVVLGEEKQQLIDSFDVFLHTSRHEGMPGAILEAMSRGIPCLVTPGTNMQEMIENCQGGWGCALNVNAIVEALSAISYDRKGIAERGIAARTYVLDHFTWSKIAQQYVRKIKELL